MKKKNVITIILAVFIVTIILIFVFLNKKDNTNNSYTELNPNIKPVIYYSVNEESKMPLLEDNTVFTSSIKISWTKECVGNIKKEGKDFSSENNTTLVENGTYQITTSLPNNKENVTKNLIIDTMPPKVELKQNSDGTYTIVFEDINDVANAELVKLNPETDEVISEKDLIKEGLQKRIDVKEKGYYILKATDKNGNTTNSKLSFEIK